MERDSATHAPICDAGRFTRGLVLDLPDVDPLLLAAGHVATFGDASVLLFDAGADVGLGRAAGLIRCCCALQRSQALCTRPLDRLF